MSLPLLRLATLSATTSSDTRPDRHPRIYTKTNSGFLRAERRGGGDNFARVFRTEFGLFRLGQLLFHVYIFSSYFEIIFSEYFEKIDAPITVSLSR